MAQHSAWTQKRAAVAGLLLGLAGLASCSSDSKGSKDGASSDAVSDLFPHFYKDLGIPIVEAKICGEAAFDISRVIPDMLILLDRSNSMATDTPPLWNVVVNAVNTVTAAMDSSIWFGLMAFPNSLAPKACTMYDNTCEPASAPLVQVKAGAAGSIKIALSDLAPCGGTPIAASLKAAAQYLSTLTDGHPRYILLTTDGAPNCNSALDGSSCTCLFPPCTPPPNNNNCLDDTQANATLADLCKSGVKTYVLGMGAAANTTSILQALATSGCTNKYYLASDPDPIKQALTDIAGSIASCQFQLDCSKIPDVSKVNFYFDGKVVPQSTAHKTGWDWIVPCQSKSGQGKVEFYGADCESILNKKVTTVSAKFGCATVIDR
jgi:hypothetical protein